MFERMTNLINHPGLPWAISVLIVLWSLFVLVRFRALARRAYQGVSDAADALATYTSPAALARNLDALDSTLNRNSLLAPAWSSYRATLFLSVKSNTIQSSDSAEKHFILDNLGTPLPSLRAFQTIPSHLANAGLAFTFFSLLVAIQVSGTTIVTAQGPSLQAIQELFQVASFKFLSAIAGISSSMLLSAVIRNHLQLLEQRTIQLGQTLKRMVPEVPRETMVLEQIAKSSLNAEPNQEILEQFPKLADSLSAQITAVIDERLGGMIRQATRPLLEESRRENARHQQTQESLLADFREDVKRGLAEAREIADAETQTIKRSVRQIEHLAEAIKEKPTSGLHLALEDLSQTISRQGADLAERIGTPNLAATVVESLHALSRHHGSEAESVLKKMMQDTLAHLSTPGFLQPILDHIRQEIEQTAQELHPHANMEPILAEVKSGHEQLLTAQNDLKDRMDSLTQSLAQPVFMDQLSRLIHDESEHLLSTWQETMKERPASATSPSASDPEFLQTLQGLISEQTIVEPIVRSVRDELQRISTLIQPQSSTEINLEAFEDKLVHIQDSIRQLAIPEPDLNPILESLEQRLDNRFLQLTQMQAAMDEGNHAILVRLEEATQQLREEMSHNTTNHHRTLLQLFGDTTREEHTKVSLEPLLKTLDDMNGGLHNRMEEMLNTLQQETNRLTMAQTQILEISQRASLAVADALGHQPNWEGSLSILNDGLERKFDAILDVIRQEADEMARAQKELLVQQLPGDGHEQQAVTHLQEALEREHTRVIEHMDKLGQAARDEARLVADKHLEALCQTINDSFARSEQRFDLVRDNTDRIAGEVGAMNHLLESLPQLTQMQATLQEGNHAILMRLEEATQQLREEISHSTTNQHHMLLQLFGDTTREENSKVSLEPLLKTLDDMNGGLHNRMEEMLTTLQQETNRLTIAQSQILEISQQASLAVADALGHQPNWQAPLNALNEGLGQKIDVILQVIRQEASEIALAQKELLAQQHPEAGHGQDVIIHLQEALEREHIRVIEHVDRLGQAAIDEARLVADKHLETLRQTINESFASSGQTLDIGPVIDTIRQHTSGHLTGRDLEMAVHSILQGQETQSAHIQEHVSHSIQSSSQPVLQLIESQSRGFSLQIEGAMQKAAEPMLHAMESQLGRVMEHVDRSLHGVSQPVLQAMETQSGRLVEHLYRSLQTASQPVLQSVETHSGRIVEHLYRSIQNASQPVMQSIEAQAGRIVESMERSVQNATQPLMQSIESQTGRIVENVDRSVQNATQPLMQSIESQTGRIVENVDRSV
ncbi:MAG: hypothetical protein HQL79_10400, partial [Magnetococcales bacterium]|nr:hypothetical protein [Magnetococcales bacterium]